MSDFRILKRSAVEQITGLSRSGIYAKMADGSFPLSVKISKKSVGWLQHEVQAWLENCISVSRGGVS